MHPCPFCHAPLPQDVGFCPTCGQQIQWVVPPQPPEASQASPEAPTFAPPVPPPSILTRELPLQHEARERGGGGGETVTTRVRPTDVSSSFRIARPLPPEEPPADDWDRSAMTERSDRSGLDDDQGPLPRVVKVAPLWRRFCAWLVDSGLLLLILWGFLWLANGLVHRGSSSRQDGLDWVAETVLAYSRVWVPALGLFSLITVGYLALFTALGGQTPGKRLLGLQVVDANGGEPGILRSAVRALLALGSGLLVLMGFLLVLFDRRRQTLHDKLARTFVICQS